MSRSDPPRNEPLWPDMPGGESGERRRRSGEPPDWALPAWDAVDDAGAEAEGGAEAETQAPQDEGVGAPPDAGVMPAAAPGPVASPLASSGLRILRVSDVTRVVRDAVRTQPDLRDVWVEGEVGRVTVSSAGHCYFTLKDDRSQLACVFFRDDRQASPFEPRTGFTVVVHGRVDVFETQGVYQLYVSSVQPAGFGDLALQFEALKAKLAAEGLFDSARKRPLPIRPAVIGVATSSSGAVWHDIQHVISRRWPLASVLLSPCQVQGEGAAASVVAALDRLARYSARCEAEGRPEDAPAVVILARGGGSLEDLWPFNDERVVRAVAAHPVPVVSGVGHEVDVTLADFAADVRAPTPSAAAELVVPDRVEIAAALGELGRRAAGLTARLLATARAELVSEGRVLDGLKPAAQLAQARERAGYMLERATRSMRAELGGLRQAEERLAERLRPVLDARVALARGALEQSHTALAALGPQATLDRGYAIVRRRADDFVVRGPDEAPAGSRLSIKLARGDLAATVDEASGDKSGGS